MRVSLLGNTTLDVRCAIHTVVTGADFVTGHEPHELFNALEIQTILLKKSSNALQPDNIVG